MPGRRGAATVLAAILALGVTGAPARAGCRDVTLVLRTYHVELEAGRKSYRAGGTATIVATVTQPAHEDPLGAGVELEPPASVPAERVAVGVGLVLGRRFLSRVGVTDGSGRTTIRVELPPDLPAGKMTASGFAWETVFNTPCLIVEQIGYAEKARLFRVRPARG